MLRKRFITLLCLFLFATCIAAAADTTEAPSYFRHRDEWYDYGTAQDGFLLTVPGEYIAGLDFPAGVYTVHVNNSQGEILVSTYTGLVLHRFFLSGNATASFYLGESMCIYLPEGMHMTGLVNTVRFQSTDDMAEIDAARYYLMMECPGRKYFVKSRKGMNGYVAVYNMDAEMGRTEPYICNVPEDEEIIISLAGLYNTFVELHECIIWPAEEGAG